MKNKDSAHPLIGGALLFISLLQPAALPAAEPCRDIGGTGIIANGCGVGGTGLSAGKKEDIGGTGHTGTESGVGGTGIVASKSGIGGTGHEGGIGGTGIVGIVTGFGSIWVNGLEVQYDAKTPVADNTSVANPSDLAIGQVVTIEASESNTQLKASRISVVNAVAGQITSLDAGNGKFVVLGQSVTLTSKTLVHDRQAQQSPIQLHQDDYVKVSGLRLSNGEIVASRVERTGEIAEPSLVGPITKKDGQMINIYGQQIVAENNSLAVGQEVLVSGKLVDGKLLAREITASPAAQLYGKTEHIQLQGYTGKSASEGQIKVGNLEVVVSKPAITSSEKVNLLMPDELVQVSGHFDNEHRIIADKIEFSHDRPERVQHESTGGRDHDNADKPEHTDKAERMDSLDRGMSVDRPDSLDRPDHPDSPNRSDSVDYDDAYRVR